MHNRKEYKVVVLDGVPKYVAKIGCDKKSKGGINQAFSQYPHTELMLFAGDMVQKMKENCPNVICDGLFRVDIFQKLDGALVVNELESLEANYGGVRSVEEILAVIPFLVEYWKEKLRNAVFRYMRGGVV